MRKIEESWIKISRKILEWGWYTDIKTFKVFMHLLIKANWKDGEFLGVKIKRGSYATSYANLSAECGLTVSEVRTAIDHLKSTNEIASKQHAKFTVFTVLNYNRYQDTSQAVDKHLAEESQEIDKHLANDSQAFRNNRRIEERKKGRKEERKNNPPYPPYFPDDEKLDSAFADFVDFRRRMKAPLSDMDCEKVKRRLMELSTKNGIIDRNKAVEIINQSILNGWKGLFPLDRDKKPRASPQENEWDALRRKYEGVDE